MTPENPPLPQKVTKAKKQEQQANSSSASKKNSDLYLPQSIITRLIKEAVIFQAF